MTSKEIAEIINANIELAKVGETTSSTNWKNVIDNLIDKEVNRVLNEYSEFLEKHGYLDADWWSDNPNTIERFIKSKIK